MFRWLLTALCVLLFGLQATCAAIPTSSTSLSEKARLEPSAGLEDLSPTQNAQTSIPVLQHHGANDQKLGFQRKTDWRNDEALKLQAEREAGFVASSFNDNEIPLPDFWPLFKISVVSAIAIAILKVIRDIRR
ncbi:unnamed protein product [Penicillium salamii]|uniref:Uncharacterized protein n=1 Tax=Penicillium salamii TaxID=1612424 RepID=A0A9W4NHC3_9EURO|nr:unnamed protein product [Penicillium salamii]CAG7980585.1 unnamed protein product [Penicillium salamii]CAG8078447.1 unnamed protein product [Penicillium salamii]CAG8081983.1 unnamed protein product [Penicillium salamii]CAG8240971.1 unnamed protein product [Penicillium salamii]